MHFFWSLSLWYFYNPLFFLFLFVVNFFFLPWICRRLKKYWHFNDSWNVFFCSRTIKAFQFFSFLHREDIARIFFQSLFLSSHVITYCCLVSFCNNPNFLELISIIMIIIIIIIIENLAKFSLYFQYQVIDSIYSQLASSLNITYPTIQDSHNLIVTPTFIFFNIHSIKLNSNKI
jgi:hypothetical protein